MPGQWATVLRTAYWSVALPAVAVRCVVGLGHGIARVQSGCEERIVKKGTTESGRKLSHAVERIGAKTLYTDMCD
jgi:hypothetical protein